MVPLAQAGRALHANSMLVQAKVRALGGLVHAAPQLEQQIGAQALVMTYNDIFWLLGCARSRAAAGPVLRPFPRMPRPRRCTELNR
jgi:DHA2 family multidrug resistance protein